MVVTPQESFLTLDEAAQALACDPETVRQLAAAGEIRGRKVGRAWVFTASALAAYCNAGQSAKVQRWRSTNEAKRGGRTSPSEASALGARLAQIRPLRRSGASAS